MKFEYSAVAALLSAVGAVVASPIYVDDDAPASGDGQSWGTAYRFLQDALDEAEDRVVNLGEDPADIEIWIGQGTYLPDRDELNPTGTGDRNALFDVYEGISVYGGWRGLSSGGRADDYSPDRFKTVLSGDLAQNDGSGFSNYTENSESLLRVTRVSPVNQGPVTRVAGLTISDAFESSAVLVSADRVDFIECVFEDNYTAPPGTFGGISVVAAFNSNSSTQLRIFSSTFRGNRDDGGIGFGVWTPMVSSSFLLEMVNTTFVENDAQAAFGSQASELLGCVIAGNGFNELTRSDFAMTNCTVADNDEFGRAGVDYTGLSVSEVKNSIYSVNVGSGSSNIRYSSSWTAHAINPSQDIDGRNLSLAVDGDILFADPSSDDYRITAGSPGIDAGRNVLVPHIFPTAAPDGRGRQSRFVDAANNDRFVDDPTTIDATPLAGDTDLQSAVADLGAFEYQGAKDSTNSGTDADGNGILDSFDPDCDGNGTVDAIDIASDVYGDRDLDGVPDILGCEPDCDGNGVVDIVEILDGLKEDFNRNGIPDVCEDCNANLRADSLECAFDVLLMLDNSGSQGGGDFFCEVRTLVQAGLNEISAAGAGAGGRVRLERIYPSPSGATDPVPPCGSNYVATGSDPVPCAIPGCSQYWGWEAWGAGTAAAADKEVSQSNYWLEAHKRVIIPIADELPDAGSPCSPVCLDPEIPTPSALAAAEATIDNAVAMVSDPLTIANVFPIIGADASELVVSFGRELSGVDDPNRDGGILDLQDLQSRGATPEVVAEEILEFILNTEPTCAVCQPANCIADLNGDDVLDLADISLFVTGFQNGDPISDLADPVGVFDLADISAFVTAFNIGCD